MIQHVSLEVRRSGVDADARFWELLGFSRVQPPESLRDRALWLARGPQHVHLLFADAPVAPPSGHTALHLEDYQAVCDRLRAGGFEVEPRTRHWGAARSYVRSPGGHLVELMSAPPPT